MSREHSRRFLNAFIDIEQSLRQIARLSRHKPFYQMVTEAGDKDPFVRELSIELKKYGDLRNVIVHERINEEPIAEPHPEVVTRIEKIRDLLRTPPSVDARFLGPVVSCQVEDTLSDAARQMYKHSFSKIPVYQGEQFVGLLTAEAITYWLADCLIEGKDLSRESVGTVMKYVDNPDNYAFVAKNSPVFEVIRLFEHFSHKGNRLQAVLITENGERLQKPLGIITVFDLPRIYRMLEG